MNKDIKKTVQKDQKVGQIMGVKIDSTSMGSVLTRVEENISDNIRFNIVTPNPELVLMAQKNNLLKNALNSATLSIPDGMGLKLAIPNLQIIKGRELFIELIKLAAKKNWKVFLLGGLGDEAGMAANKLIQRYGDIKIQSEKGPKLNESAEPVTEVDIKLEEEAIERINTFKPHLLFVAFGNPKQEIWVMKNAKKLNAKCVMAVGGAIRYAAGISSLPPKWMASVGLEWLWRVFTEPHRITRIFNAVILFPLKLFLYKLLEKN